MGMYDVIEDVLYCPFCGAAQSKNYFQTKDFDNILAYKTITNYLKEAKETRKLPFEIYAPCIKCNRWISLNISD